MQTLQKSVFVTQIGVFYAVVLIEGMRYISSFNIIYS